MIRARLLRLVPVVVALYALAALTLGLAHRSLAAGLDAALGDVCIAASDAAGDGDRAAGGPHANGGAADRGCDACRLTAGPGLPPPPPAVVSAPAGFVVDPIAVHEAAARVLSIFRAVSRGPPSGLPIA